MEIKKYCETTVPVVSFIIFISLITYIFFLRPPVIFVTDVYFSAIYGEKFEQVRRLEASIKILRQIKIVRIMEETSSLSIAESVQAASSRPKAVFFAYAYLEAAEYYASINKEANNPYTNVFIFLEGNHPRKTSESYYLVRNDADVDYFRAGACAALLTNETEVAFLDDRIRQPVIFIHDTDINTTEKNSFSSGLQENGFTGRVDFAGSYDNRNWDNAAAVVIQGSAAAFMQATARIPTILFSWFADINYMPDNIKILVDDSPYYFIPKAMHLQEKNESETRVFSLPSKFVILKDRITNKALLKDLTKAASPIQSFTP